MNGKCSQSEGFFLWQPILEKDWTIFLLSIIILHFYHYLISNWFHPTISFHYASKLYTRLCGRSGCHFTEELGFRFAEILSTMIHVDWISFHSSTISWALSIMPWLEDFFAMNTAFFDHAQLLNDPRKSLISFHQFGITTLEHKQLDKVYKNCLREWASLCYRNTNIVHTNRAKRQRKRILYHINCKINQGLTSSLPYSLALPDNCELFFIWNSTTLD